MNQNLCVNKANFHMKGFALGLTLKQRRKATRKSPITWKCTVQIHDLLMGQLTKSTPNPGEWKKAQQRQL